MLFCGMRFNKFLLLWFAIRFYGISFAYRFTYLRRPSPRFSRLLLNCSHIVSILINRLTVPFTNKSTSSVFSVLPRRIGTAKNTQLFIGLSVSSGHFYPVSHHLLQSRLFIGFAGIYRTIFYGLNLPDSWPDKFSE